MQEFVGINVLVDRLDLQEWDVTSKLDRDVGFDDPHVVELGAEPIIRLDDAFEHLIRRAWKIGHAADKQTPAGRGFSDTTGPHLQPTGLNGGREEWRREPAHAWGRNLVELFAKVGVLHGVAG